MSREGRKPGATVRDYAERERGLKDKAQEFRQQGSEIYVKS